MQMDLITELRRPLAVHVVASTWEADEALRARMRVLAQAGPALDLRAARLLAWLRIQNLAPLGYPGWQSFLREHVDWKEGWVRSLVRLVRSGLRKVLQAASEGRIALSDAVYAPAECAPETQEEWIAAVRAGARHRIRRASGASSTIEPAEADALTIWHARQKARLLEGLPLSDREADERMRAWWKAEQAQPGEIGPALVATAFAPAPRPRSAPGDDAVRTDGGGWEGDDPADPLVGPWRQPRDPEEALALLAPVLAARRSRVVELGSLYERVVRQALYKRWGHRSVEAFCQATMGRSARSLQRDAALGRILRRLPALSAAAEAGMSLARVEAIGRAASEFDVDRWVAVARRTGVGELARASAHVAAGADPSDILDAYEALMATTTGAVALESLQAPVPPTLTDRVHPDVPAAARWLLTIAIPPQRGFGKVKELARFVCANPECRRRALRNHAHHIRLRKNGGSDEIANGACACPSCHTRLLHGGVVEVEKQGANLVWHYPGRVVTVAPGPQV